MRFRTSMMTRRFTDAEPQPKTCSRVLDDATPEFEPVADAVCAETPAEHFAKASDRRNNLDNGRPSEAELSQMTPQERFVACSDARNRLNPNYKRDALRRRRE